MLGRQCGVKLLPPTLQAKIDASGTINQSSQAQDVPMASVIQLKLMCPFPDIERISDSDDDLLRRYLIRTEYDWREYHGNTLILGIEWPFDFDRNSLVVSSKVTRVSAMISSLFFEADGTVVNEIGPTYFQACYNTLQKLSTRDLDERSFVALYLLAMTLTIFEWHLAETLACFKALHSLLDLLHQSLTPTRAKPLFNAWEVALSHYLSLVVSRVRHRGKMDTETTEVAEWLASVIMGGKVGVLNNNAYGYGNQVILLLLWCCHRTELDSSSSPQIAACLQVASAEVKNHVIRIKLSDISSNVQPYHYITYAANLIIRFISATTEEAWKGQEVYSMAEEMWAFSERLLAGDLGDSLWDNHKSHSSDDNEILPSDSEEGETMTESSGDLPDSGEALSDDNDKEEVIREFSKVRIFYTSPTPTTFREIFGGELSCFRILGFFMAGLIFSSASNPGGISSSLLITY